MLRIDLPFHFSTKFSCTAPVFDRLLNLRRDPICLLLSSKLYLHTRNEQRDENVFHSLLCTDCKVLALRNLAWATFPMSEVYYLEPTKVLWWFSEEHLFSKFWIPTSISRLDYTTGKLLHIPIWLWISHPWCSKSTLRDLSPCPGVWNFLSVVLWNYSILVHQWLKGPTPVRFSIPFLSDLSVNELTSANTTSPFFF